MPYPVGHRARVRGKIIASARRLFNRHGFENVSVQQIMAGAGLTHGGFYSYFRSKNELSDARRILQLLSQQERALHPGAGVFPDRP